MSPTITLEKDLRYYRLVFFQGTRQDEKIFPFKGGQSDAILRGRLHCERMGYRFGIVRPAIVDLDHQENLKASDSDWNELKNEPVLEVSKVEVSHEK